MEMNGGFLVTKIKQLGDRIFEKILSEKNTDISSEKYKKSSPSDRLSLDSRLSSDSIIYRVKTTAVCVVIAS